MVVYKEDHGGHIETDHQVTCSMPEDTARNFVLPNSTASGPGALREVIENNTTTKYKLSPNGLEITKGHSLSVSMMLKTEMEAVEDCTIFKYGPPISKNKLSQRIGHLWKVKGLRWHRNLPPQETSKVELVMNPP